MIQLYMAHNYLKVTCVVTSDKKFVAVEPPSLDEQGSKLVIQLAVDCVFMVLNVYIVFKQAHWGY